MLGAPPPDPQTAPFAIADFWLRACYETNAAHTSKFKNLTIRSFRASQLATAYIYSNEVVPPSLATPLLPLSFVNGLN